jgi:HEPN domain-containing protein
MRPDPVRLADAESWLRKASNDLRCAAIDLAATPPVPEDALFHCQQAIEKVLKAFLVWHDVPFAKTHDLGKLGTQAVQIDPSLEEFVVSVVDLSKYAWIFRYPGEPVEPGVDEAHAVLARTKPVIDEFLRRIGGLEAATGSQSE